MVADRTGSDQRPKAQGAPHGGGPRSVGPRSGEELGRYQLIRKLAKGGMAEVYLARSVGAFGFEKLVAIKRILPHYGNDAHFLRMMVDEAKITVLLNHPNIASILELGQQDGEHFIVMEFVGGQSLSAVMKRVAESGERLGILEACAISVEMLQGLHAAHVQTDATGRPANIIHRDVSPQNVLVAYDGHVKLIDFGIARAKNRLERTEVGTIKGKLRYLAPEMIDPARFAPDGDFDHRVDVWAAGVVLHEMVAWRKLFVGDSDLDVYEAIVDGTIPNLHAAGKCDAELSEIIERALQRDPETRFPTAEAFADALRAYLYRSDSSFTQKRIATVLERFFAEEKESLLNLSTPELPADAPAEIALTSTRIPARSQASRAARAARGRLASALPSVQPGAATQVAVEGQALAMAATGERQGDGTSPSRRGPRAVAQEAATGTQLPHSGSEDVDGLSDRRVFDDVGDEPTIITQERPSTDVAVPQRETYPRKIVQRRRSPYFPIIVAAFLGLIVAMLGVMALELTGTRPQGSGAGLALVEPSPASDQGENVTGATGLPAEVPVVVTVSPVDATVREEGHTPPLVLNKLGTTVLAAAAGKTIRLHFSAPGYSDFSETVTVEPGQRMVQVQRELEPLPVELKVTTVPPKATVLVDGKPLRSASKVTPGRVVHLLALAKGYLELSRDLTPVVGTPLEVRLVLKEQAATHKKQINRVVKRPVGKGTLVVTTSGKWGRVTVDGKVYEETTPMKVKLTAGTHRVEVAHPPLGLVRKFTVRIQAGEQTRRSVDF